MAGKNKVVLTFAGDAAQLQRTLKEVQHAGTVVEKGLGGIGVGLAGLAAAGAAAPLIAAGALLGVGAGFIGLGVMAAAQSEKVKASFTGLGEHVKKETQKLAAPFEPVLLNISERFRAAFDRIGPMLGSMFATAAPYLSTLTSGVIGFVEGAMPGLKTGLELMGPIITAFANGIRSLGPALGEFVVNLTGGQEGAQRTADAVTSLFNGISWLLPVLGSAINFLAQWGPTLLPLAGIVYGVIGGLKAWSIAQGILNVVMAANPIGLWIVGITALVAGIVWAWNNIDGFRNGVKAAWAAITSAFSTAVSAVGGFISSMVAKVRAVPGMIMGALSGLGNLLVNSGRSLIEGLWRGIQGAIGWVKGKIGGALSAIRNLFPFSPAKEGPFSGKGYTLHSGKALMTDFGKGMASVDLRGITSSSIHDDFARDLAAARASGKTIFEDLSWRGMSSRYADDDLRMGPRKSTGGALTLSVAPGADSAVATMINGLIRAGKIQLRTA